MTRILRINVPRRMKIKLLCLFLGWFDELLVHLLRVLLFAYTVEL